MTTSRKIVRGTQRGLSKAIEAYTDSGWTVERTEVVPRGQFCSKYTYIAYLNKDSEDK